MYLALRPLLFLVPPGAAHAAAFEALAPAEYLAPVRAGLRAACTVRDPRLVVRVMGLEFPTPVGLAGGFDKNGQRVRALAALGFGHIEVGTVTAVAQEANPAPNLFRLEKDRALVNRLGFPNEGAARVAARLAARGCAKGGLGVPLGVSIGKSRVVPAEDLEAVIADYAASFEEVRRVADFVVVNVSSPNTRDLRAMQEGERLRPLLARLREASESRVPILVKVAPDLSEQALDAVFAAVKDEGLAGVVATNTTVSREGLHTDAGAVARIGAGGLSGPPLHRRAIEVVARARSRLGPEAVVIGVGGVEDAGGALAFLRAGANLVQMYTGFIYGGPGIPRRLGRELAELV